MRNNKYTIIVNKYNEFVDNSKFSLMKVLSEYKQWEIKKFFEQTKEVDDKYEFNTFFDMKDTVMVEKRTYKNWKRLKKYANKNGYEIEIESAYRSKEYQKEIFKEVVKEKGIEHTKKYVAKPGFSEHHTGLAIDYCIKKGNEYLVDFEMAEEEVIQFIKEKCYKFGFIIRYPKHKENITGYGYEPWHIRYVGKKTARIIIRKNITLEELLLNREKKVFGIYPLKLLKTSKKYLKKIKKTV